MSHQAESLTVIAPVASVRETASQILQMKLILAFIVLGMLLVGCSTAKPRPPQVPKTIFSSFDQPVKGVVEHRYGKDEINFKSVHMDEILIIYGETAGRNVIRGSQLPSPTVTLRNSTPVTRVEALQLLDSVLAQNGIAMVLSGENSVKAVPIAAVGKEAGPVIDLPADQLPDSGSFMVRIVHLKKTKPSELMPVIQPFAKVSNGIIPMDREKVIVLRDFSANIKQMLKLVDIAEGRGGH